MRPAGLTQTILILIASALLLQPAGPLYAGYSVGDTVEDFLLMDVDGEPFHLSDFTGDVILLNFWRDG